MSKRKNTAVHLWPTWGEKANFIIMAKIQNESTDYTQEQLWVRRISNHIFELCCIPFFVYDLDLGDIVETDNNYLLSKVISRSGRYTFRIWLGETKSKSILESVLNELINMKCTVEKSSKNLFAISTPSLDVAEKIGAYLEQLETSGLLQFETGHTKP
jgi:hypothetical protein